MLNERLQTTENEKSKLEFKVKEVIKSIFKKIFQKALNDKFDVKCISSIGKKSIH